MNNSKPKLKKKSAASAASAGSHSAVDSAKSLLETAQQVWMAGMGAFGRAQEEGAKLFEGLLKEGMTLEQKTRRFATGHVDVARDAVESTVAQVKERASDTWDRLEHVFEERVSRALGKLGVPGRAEIQALVSRVEELNRAIRKSGTTSAPKAKRPVKRAKKAASKRAVKESAV